MSISNDALKKASSASSTERYHTLTPRQILLEIEQKSTFSSQQIQVVKTQLATKARENRMLQLTANEVGALPRETHIYEGVGKM